MPWRARQSPGRETRTHLPMPKLRSSLFVRRPVSLLNPNHNPNLNPLPLAAGQALTSRSSFLQFLQLLDERFRPALFIPQLPHLLAIAVQDNDGRIALNLVFTLQRPVCFYELPALRFKTREI